MKEIVYSHKIGNMKTETNCQNGCSNHFEKLWSSRTYASWNEKKNLELIMVNHSLTDQCPAVIVAWQLFYAQNAITTRVPTQIGNQGKHGRWVCTFPVREKSWNYIKKIQKSWKSQGISNFMSLTRSEMSACTCVDVLTTAKHVCNRVVSVSFESCRPT